ncbi:hypothetical protein PR048_001662 [Dryococelus australis]|uniref:Uncharacterized protein n=1 Tax=Dryococelus australis TaxID=614101 RepID=A0ABQ9IKF9_9NEOP|nr:hypothetical protein PR048_001662 [Dryococelus australis]
MWKITRQLRGKSKKVPTPAIKIPDGPIYNSKGKSNAIADSPNDFPQDRHFTTQTLHHLQQFLNQPVQTEPALTTEAEIMTTIKSLPKNKAPGQTRYQTKALIITISKQDKDPPDTQFGFRAKYSTIHPLITLVEDVALTFQTGQDAQENTKDKAYTLTTFLDV